MSTFGRKGMAAGAIAQPRAAFGTASRFGAAADAAPAATSDDPYAAQRAAFLASERARHGGAEQDAGQDRAPDPSFDRLKAKAQVIVGGKSLGTAYVLWFFLGGLSVHRFYLGHPLSAIAQVCLWYVSLMFVMAGFGLALITLIAGGLWLLADAFVIPTLVRGANEKARERAVSHTFA